VICTATFARTDGEPYAGFHFGFVYPLSTNGTGARYYTNGVSLNLLADVSKNEKAAALSGLANIVLHDAGGVQAAGLYYRVGNQGRGVMLSGLAGVVRHDYTGVQAAGLIGVAGNVSGLHLAALLEARIRKYACSLITFP
jgi:alanine dehydrogenase